MRIVKCVNHGSIIQMFVDDPAVKKKEKRVINWDRRMFEHFLDSLLAEYPSLTTLVSLEIEYDGEQVFIRR